MKKVVIFDILIVLIVILFAYTAFSKLFDQNLFILQMSRSPIYIMQLAAPFLGWIIPVMELLIVAGLMITRFQIKALEASLALFIIFEVYIVSMLLTGLHLPCSCGGVIGKMTWKQHIPFNLFFIASSGYALKIKKQQKELAIT
jgi:putative oxidoreductase